MARAITIGCFVVHLKNLRPEGKQRTSENEWTAAAPLLRRALHTFYARVRIRRLGGRGEGRELRWVQTSFSWVQNKMRAAFFAPWVAGLVNPRIKTLDQNPP